MLLIFSVEEYFDKVYGAYRRADYFNTELEIKNNIERRDKGGYDKVVHSDELIRATIDRSDKERVFNKVFMPLYYAIKNKDKESLLKRLYYDQKFSLEVFSDITGMNIKKASNKKIKEVVEKYVTDGSL